jgi:hypothetical protein
VWLSGELDQPLVEGTDGQHDELCRALWDELARQACSEAEEPISLAVGAQRSGRHLVLAFEGCPGATVRLERRSPPAGRGRSCGRLTTANDGQDVLCDLRLLQAAHIWRARPRRCAAPARARTARLSRRRHPCLGASAINSPSFRIATVSLTRWTSSRMWSNRRSWCACAGAPSPSRTSRRPIGSQARGWFVEDEQVRVIDRACAIPSRWRSPPEKPLIGRSALSSRPTSSSVSWLRCSTALRGPLWKNPATKRSVCRAERSS